MLHQAQHFDHDGLLHLGAGVPAGQDLMLVARVRGIGGATFRFGGHFPYAFFNSCARKSVFTRTRSFFASRRRLSASACPVVNCTRRWRTCPVSSFCSAVTSLAPASRL